MSEIKQINTGVAELLAVKVPEGCSYRVHRVLEQYIQCHHYWGKEIIQTNIPLPPGNWTPLGIDTELTEEQCGEVMPTKKARLLGADHTRPMYLDYTDEYKLLHKAKEAFASLMQANGCYAENPYGEEPAETFNHPEWEYTRANWQQAEANTGTWLILKRLS